MTDVFNRLVDVGLTPNSYYVLHCIKEKVVPHNFVNKNLEYERLKSEKWLDDDLKLTSKSLIFMEEINGFFKKSKKKTSKHLMGDQFFEKIKEYIEIFPNRKLESGKYARCNPKNLENSFRWFFETYDYDWDLIIKATEKYVDEYEVRNYKYMRTSQYFIRKQDNDKTFDSDLANYCEMIKNNPDEGRVYFKERIV
jgi:hypothetical protein